MQGVVSSHKILADDVDKESASQSKDDEQSTSWLPQYMSAQLQEKQEDPDLEKLITWLENDVTPTTQELYLSSPALKKFWLNKNLLTTKTRFCITPGKTTHFPGCC